MITIAYLANQFPSALEPYVSDEIRELRRWGVRVIPGSVRKSRDPQNHTFKASSDPEMVCLEPLPWLCLLRALALLISQRKRISDLMKRVLIEGRESPVLRLKALIHTWLGAYYAVRLREHSVDHIHAHHGYFGSWIAMVAARLLEIDFSLTLHGSDLLLHAAFLDAKLKHSRFCVTISEYNRRYVLRHFPEIEPRAIIVSRLGVDLEPVALPPRLENASHRTFRLLSVGRLHPVKTTPS